MVVDDTANHHPVGNSDDDKNGNGRIDVADVVWLFDYL